MNQMVPQKPLENLASREAYDLDETEYRKRVPWMTGLTAAGLGGVGFGLFFPWAFIGGMSLGQKHLTRFASRLVCRFSTISILNFTHL
jgi:hypothetical protein